MGDLSVFECVVEYVNYRETEKKQQFKQRHINTLHLSLSILIFAFTISERADLIRVHFLQKKGAWICYNRWIEKNRKFNYNLCQVWKVVFHCGWTALADDHIREIFFFFFLQTFLSSTLETSRRWLSAYLLFGYFSLLLVSCTILFSLRFCCYLKEKFFLSLLCPPSLLYCWMLSKEIKVSLKSSKKCTIFWKQKLMGAMKEQRVHSLQLSKKIWVCS